MFYVYVLKSVQCDRFYIGQTMDLEERLKWHNSPRARWTKRYQPWEIVYKETFATRSEAILREAELKALKNIRSFLNL
ncbi:MAG TPA: GIY-YIG nuclease family protein [Ignavibacteria bacterium]|nr:GIY-YIG nuclease family protein [Ignavibacteria bacterium]